MLRPELLAPVGSKEALIAAISNGADAVYFGGKLFNARHYASNFTHDELEWAIDYAHARGATAYVTVNTLIKDSELDDAAEYLQFLCNAGTDAVIVQDLGIMRLLREKLPGLPVHASTQMTLHNLEGVRFMQEMGAKRAVLARELSLDEIRRIKSQTSIEIETFIHGALCFSYSGQCLLSSMIGGRSGNRGHCAQPCRKKYRIDEVEGYLLSTKDLNMSEHIPALVEAGIDSFKIEGRMKRPEYVAGVVSVYRKLIDRYLEAPGNFQVSDRERQTLSQLFNREFTTGYFFGNQGGKMMSRRYPHNIGTELGKVIDYERKRRRAVISLKAPLRTGDGIGIRGRETGITVRNMYVNDRRTDEAVPGSTVWIPLDEEVARGDEIFKTHDAQLMASLKIKDTKKIHVSMLIKARIGEPAELTLTDGENEVKVHGINVSMADNMPLSEGVMADHLKKLGNTVFDAREITFEKDENIFIPVSELNRLRREAVLQLERIRAQKWTRKCSRPTVISEKKEIGSKPLLSVNTGTIECLEAAVDSGADIVYLGEEASDSVLESEDYVYAIEYGRKKGKSVFISLPRISRKIDLEALPDPDGLLVADPGTLHSLRRARTNQVVIDYPFNVFNRLTMEYLLNYSQRVTLSPELTLEEIRNLTQFGAAECIVHGLFPLIVSEHDLAKGLFPGRKDVCLKDEKGFVFPVRRDAHGRTYIMNSRELCMLEHVPEILEAAVECLRIEARMYDKNKTVEITRAYREAMDKLKGRGCKGKYTTGYYFRGVV